jgi:hypothetical protein
MMRNKPASSMQKTYDECYLICSTAVYFEGQVEEIPNPGMNLGLITELEQRSGSSTIMAFGA